MCCNYEFYRVDETVRSLIMIQIRSLIILLLLSLLIIAPAAAEVTLGNYTTIDVYQQQKGSIQFENVYDAAFNSISDTNVDAISNIEFYNIHPGTYDFTLTQANGNTHTGQIFYNTSGILGTTAEWTLTLDGESHSWDTVVNVDIVGKVFIATYAMNMDTSQKGLLLMDAWGGQTVIGYITGNYNCVFVDENSIVEYPITQVDVTGTDPFYLQVSYGNYDDISGELQKEPTNIWTWINNILGFVGSVGDIIFAITYAFKFIIVDHFFQIIVFYEVLVMAYSAGTSRDIFSFGKKMMRYNKALFEAILGLIKIVMEIFHRLIDALKPT